MKSLSQKLNEEILRQNLRNDNIRFFKIKDIIDHLKNNELNIKRVLENRWETRSGDIIAWSEISQITTESGILNQLESIFVERGTRGGLLNFAYYSVEPFLEESDPDFGENVHAMKIFVNGDDEMEYRKQKELGKK